MFKLFDLDMNEIRLPDGVKPLDIFVGSIAKERQTETIPGRNGVIDYGTNYTERPVDLSLWIMAINTIDYRLLRNELYALFDRGSAFYIAESNVPSRVLKVAVDESYIPERITRRHASVDITCRTLDSVFWESTYTTKELHDTGFDAIAEKYGLVDGINQDYTQYVFEQPLPEGNLIPHSDTSKEINIPYWTAWSGVGSLNGNVQNDNFFLLQQESNTRTYAAVESDILPIELIQDEQYTLTYFAEPSAAITKMGYNYLIREGESNISLPEPTVTRNAGVRTGSSYYHKYDITFTANFTGHVRVLIGGNRPSGSSSFIYFSYPRLFAGDVSKAWQPPMTLSDYLSTPTQFSVWNAGNVPVEPEYMELYIQINSATSDGDLSLKNLSTGDEFRFEKSISKRHIVLDRMNIRNGSHNAFRDTNRRFIRIAPGKNDFQITGAAFNNIMFIFKYYYK